MLSLFLSMAIAQMCPTLYGMQQENGAWVFYPEQKPGTIPVPNNLLVEKCGPDAEVLEMKDGKMMISAAKVAAKEARLAAEKIAQEKRKAVLMKIATGELSTNDDVKAALQVLMDSDPQLKEEIKNNKVK